MGNSSSGSSGHPGVPSWGRGLADYVFDSKKGPGAIQGGIQAGQDYLSPASLFPQIAQLLGPAMQGGSYQRNIASDLTANGLMNTTALANQGMAGANQANQFSSLVPALFGAANDFAGNINQAEGGAFKPAMQAGQETLQNVMNPTLYNPLFQNAAANITPEINSAFSSRGLGSSGAATAALGSQYSNLADSFAQRQMQEQLGAQQSLANTGTQFANTGIQGAQLPGQIFNQFMQGMNTGQGINTQALQNQFAPMQMLGAGADQYWQGVNNPMNVLNSAFSTGQQPLETGIGAVTGITGGVTIPHQGWLGKTLGK